MIAFRSLSARLTIFYALVFSLLLVLCGAVSYFLVAQKLHQAVDQSIQAQAQMVARVIATQEVSSFRRVGLQQAVARMRPLGLERGVMEEGRYIQVLDGAGRIVYRSPNLVDRRLPVPTAFLRQAFVGEASFETVSFWESHPLRVVTLPFHHDGRLRFFVQVGYYTEEITWALKELLVALLVLAPGGLLLSCVLGWGMARRALHPVDQMAQAARRICSRNLRERIAIPRRDDELRRLAEIFNDMLQRLDEAFAKMRQFADDASHELRTPLSVMRGEADIALTQDRSSEEYRRVLRSLLEEVDHMGRIVAGLSIVSRAEAGEMVLERGPVSWADLVGDCCEEVRPRAEAEALELTVRRLDETTVQGDAMWLKRLLINLLDNAIKYTPSGGCISLSLEAVDRGAVLVVEDTGIGIPAEDVPRIFDRFYRVDKSGSRDVPGCGLGLSICKWIVEAHGGTIEASSRLGVGTRIAVRVPSS